MKTESSIQHPASRILTLLCLLCALCVLSVNPARADVTSGLQEIGQSLANSTNWTVASGYGHSLAGGNNVAFAVAAYDFNQYVGLVAGEEYLWSSGGHSLNSVKGGITLQLPMHPFTFIGTSFVTNIVATPFVADLIATPQNGNAIGNITATGVNFDLYQFSKFEIVAGIEYANRSGQGNFDGHYLSFHLGLSRRF